MLFLFNVIFHKSGSRAKVKRLRRQSCAMFYAEAWWATYLKAIAFIEWKRKDKRRTEKGQSRRKGRKGQEKRATGWRQKSHPRLGKSALIMTRCRESVSPGGMAGSGSMTLLDQLDSQRDKQTATLFHYSECWMYSISSSMSSHLCFKRTTAEVNQS